MGNGPDEEQARERSRLRRFVAPTRGDRMRMLRWQAWAFVLVASGMVLVARLIPQDFRRTDDGYLNLVWGAFMVETFAFHAALVALLIMVIAIARRSWRLALAASPLAVLLAVVPLAGSMDNARSTNRAADVRVMSANLLVGNDERDAVLRQITREDPDVLVLQEYDSGWHDTFQAELDAEYEYQVHEVLWDSFGIAVYSRVPFDEDEAKLELELGSNLVPQYRIPLEVDDEPLVFYAVHLLPPTGRGYVGETREQFADLASKAGDEDARTMIVGDLNATESSPQHRELEDRGFTDAWDAAGRGRGATWPANSFLRWLPGVRIDHMYLSDGLTAVDVERGTLPGSDHRYVVVDIALSSE